MPFGSSQWMYSSGADFYNGVATQSLRFDGLTSTMQRTLVNSSNGSRRKNVWSFWAKFDTSGLSPFPYFYSKGEGGGVADIIYLRITTNHKLHFIGYISDSVTHQLITTRQFRDPNAWYHIVVAVDTTQSTASNRIQIYVNGVKETAFDTETYPSLNADLAMNWYSTANAGTTIEMISDYRASPNENYRIDGYLADYHSVDGLSFFSDTSGTANSSFNINSFGELKNGVWIPVEYTGSHGTQGYHLKFENTSVGTGSSSTVGADSAGTNHWTTNNIDTEDCAMPDSPENNFATICPLSSSPATFSEGNLKFNGSNLVGNTNFGIFNGKFYAEVYVNAGSNWYIGVLDISRGLNPNRGGSWSSTGTIAYKANGDQYSLPVGGSSATASYGASYSTGDIIGIAVDVDSDTITFYKNGVSQGNTTNGVSHISSDGVYGVLIYGTSSTLTVNFGQDPSFAGALTGGDIGTETPSEGAGVFKYAVPSGYKALCSANISDDDLPISPNADTQADDYFTPIVYAGNSTDGHLVPASGDTPDSISFAPDLIWIKNRDVTHAHILVDSVRGVDAGYLTSINTNTESGNNSLVKTIETSSPFGFTLGTAGAVNGADDLVAWVWKAGGTAVTNTQGDIQSQVSANTDAGFSIVSYTGNQTSNATVGHGLDAVLDFLIIKNRDKSVNWGIWHSDLTDSQILRFTDGTTTTPANPYFEPQNNTSSVFSLGTNDETNFNGDDYIAYCFASIEGYSKFGSYEGNAQTDGTFVYTGFRPAWILYKNIDASGDWELLDTVRNPENAGTLVKLEPNNNGGDSNRVMDILSNGFKLRNGNSNGNTAHTYIYLAFAENPFKYANAR